VCREYYVNFGVGGGLKEGPFTILTKGFATKNAREMTLIHEDSSSNLTFFEIGGDHDKTMKKGCVSEARSEERDRLLVLSRWVVKKDIILE